MREAAALLWGKSLVSRKTHAPLCSVAAGARSDPQKCFSGQAEREARDKVWWRNYSPDTCEGPWDRFYWNFCSRGERLYIGPSSTPNTAKTTGDSEPMRRARGQGLETVQRSLIDVKCEGFWLHGLSGILCERCTQQAKGGVESQSRSELRGAFSRFGQGESLRRRMVVWRDLSM